MAAIETDKAPNPWATLTEYCKAVITLASGLLAITVTFLSTFLTQGIWGTQTTCLIAGWVLLLLAIFAAFVAIGFLTNYLRTGRSGTACILISNISFYLLAFAAIAFVLFGIFSVHSKVLDVNTLVRSTIEQLPILSGKSDGDWTIDSMTWVESSKAYRMVFNDKKSNEKRTILIENNGKILEMTR
ncbi:MAG TPA: hypothetical protein VG326_12555 [Tepidisphaeraceae bacterium]|nr:hypothetical protein [Tepidisphaeraceae bacterium]